MIVLRDEQRIVVDKAKSILAEKKVVYIAGEVRVGKTPMALMTAYESGWRKVCVVTKKNAISGIKQFDYNMFLRLTITNFEQVHKLDRDYDGFIVDEAHACGQIAKPSNRAKNLRELIGDKPVILMSGTPTPETVSQIYHQFWITQYGPFQSYANFYKWARDYVDVRQKRINGWPVNDYTRGYEPEINMAISPFMVKLSQEEAGFTSFVEEEIISVPIDKRMYDLMNRLKKDKVYTMKCGDVIIADTPVKMQSLFHQLSSGTLNITKIVDEKEVKVKHVLDESKAWYIKSRFAGMKIAIFYKFIAEGNLLRKVFTNHTDNADVFNKRDDLIYIKQIISGREGVNLSTADALVMYNIDFSATSYWQARARMQTKDREKASKLFWIFSEHGIERFVHRAVVKKQNYTKSYFVRDMKQIGYGRGEQTAA